MRLHDVLVPEATLPIDGGALVGRAWVPGEIPGPSVVAVREDGVFDLSGDVPTVADLIHTPDRSAIVRSEGRPLGPLAEILANSAHDRRSPDRPWLLAPVDLQPVKASGVTFAVSLLERVIEEQAGGEKTRADSIREEITRLVGADLARVRPGSAEATRLKEHLVARGAWSQYLEVGIGPDAELFTKAPPLAAVGTGAEVGIRSDSSWNNPEPELVLVIDRSGAVAGATLGNDVNLRDLEGRSALLLSKAKDNNASTAIGPFIRLLDGDFTLDDLKRLSIELEVSGPDGFSLEGRSSMSEMTRDLAELVGQAIGPHHQYPDGLVLFTGTMFVPTEDRDQPGQGFTHKVGDVVRISCPELGTLVNAVNHSEAAQPWTFGIGALMRNLARRGLLA